MTNATKHRCAATGCNVSIALNLLMCRKHWFMVTASTRDRIWQTYQRGQELTGEFTGEYADAMRQAIREVAVQEGR